MSFVRPSWPRSLPMALVVGCATLGPIGVKLPAPGTWGSLVGLVYCAGIFRWLDGGWALAVGLAAAYLAVGLCGEAEVRLGKKDPGEVILDEFVAMPLCFIGWPALIATVPVWGLALAGFALFRFFDILKPLGIARLQNLPGGWGVVGDDLAAALAACASLHAGVWLWSLH